MRILIYAFKSYKRWKKNITEKVLEEIENKPNIVKVVFPVRLNKKMYLKKIKETTPDLVIGLGQHDNGEMFRIERKAVNIKKKHSKAEPLPIFSNKPRHYFLSQMLQEDNESWHSYSPGEDAANYSMYVISHLCKNVKFAFIHVPKNVDVKKAARFVEKKISESTRTYMPKGEQSGLSSYLPARKVILKKEE